MGLVWWCAKPLLIHIDGILPKGPYLPCLRMADRALLAGYPRYVLARGCLWTRNMGPALCRWCTSETARLIHTNSSSLEWTWYGNLQQSCAQIMCQKSCRLYLSNFKFVGIVLVLDVHCCTPLLIGLPMYITYMRPTRWWWGYLKNCWQGVRPRFSKPYPWLWRLNAKIIALPLGNGSKATYPWQ